MVAEFPASLREFPPHLLTLEFLTPAQIKGIVDYADRIKPVRQLSVAAVGVNESSPFLIETLSETCSTVEFIKIDEETENLMQPDATVGYDIIFLGGIKHTFLEKLARFSKAALVNCGSDWADPLSALAGLLTVRRNQSPHGKFYLPLPAAPRRRSLLKLCAAVDIPVELDAPCAAEKIIIQTLRQRNAKINILPEGEVSAAGEFPAAAACRESWKKILQTIVSIYTENVKMSKRTD